MRSATPPLLVTAITASAELGGTERVLLDFASHAAEQDIALRVLTPRDGPLVGTLRGLKVPAEVVAAPLRLLRGSQRSSDLWSLPPALLGIVNWSSKLAAHACVQDAQVVYTVAFKAHLAAALARRHPVVWHLHEFPPPITGWFWKFLAHRIPDALIANSEAVRVAWGGARGVAGEGTTLIPNGVNLEQFKPRERTFWIHDALGITRENRLIGMPAVFARWKGQLEVLRAFDAIQGELPDVHLVFLGGAIYDTVSERHFHRELVEAVGKRPRVHLVPFQSNVELTYPELDLVVHYSLRPEPFGRVIVEAMACGVAVIAAAEGGPTEILTSSSGAGRKGGWLVEPRDPDALARTLRSALTLPSDVLRSVGHAGCVRANAHFSARAFAARLAIVLKNASEQR